MIGSIKFGNNYNFKPENVQLKMKEVSIRQQNGEIIKVRVPETRKDLLSLNKVEIRYNVRKGQPDYKAMKSLYKLRSVFGYRLGGAIRKAYVKLAELGRHKENFVTLRKAINYTQNQKKDPTFEGRTQLDKHVRAYSTSDIIFAIKQAGTGKLDAMKYLKYMTWDQHTKSDHKLAALNDYSIRKMVVDGIKNLNNIRHNPDEFLEMRNQTEKQFAKINEEGEKQFNLEKPGKMESMKRTVLTNEMDVIDRSIKSHERALKNPKDRWTPDHQGEITKLQERREWLKTASYEQMANDHRIQTLYPEMKRLGESAYVPREPVISLKTFEKAASSESLDKAVGGIARVLQGNSPIALIKRGVQFIKCSLAPGRYHYDNINKQKHAEHIQLGLRADTPEKLNGKEPTMRELMEQIKFDNNANEPAFGRFAPKPQTD